MAHESKKEINRISLIGANKGKQVRYDLNEYVDGVLITTSETIYEEIKDEDITKIASVVPKKHRDNAKQISKLIKDNNKHLEDIRKLDFDIAKKKAEKEAKEKLKEEKAKKEKDEKITKLATEKLVLETEKLNLLEENKKIKQVKK